MENERSNLIKLVTRLLYVYSAQCRHCNIKFDYTVERADTDMLSCYCSSVYSLSAKQLVVAPITAEEYNYGMAGHLDKRINTIHPNHDYKFYKAKICPNCGKSGIQSSEKVYPIEEYCTLHPNTLIVYSDGTIKPLKDEIAAKHTTK